jgi:hypothetical protein
MLLYHAARCMDGEQLFVRVSVAGAMLWLQCSASLLVAAKYNQNMRAISTNKRAISTNKQSTSQLLPTVLHSVHV